MLENNAHHLTSGYRPSDGTSYQTKMVNSHCSPYYLRSHNNEQEQLGIDSIARRGGSGASDAMPAGDSIGRMSSSNQFVQPFP